MHILDKIDIVDNSKRYIALTLIAKCPELLHTTFNSDLCSDGRQLWVDESGCDWGQIDMPYIAIDFLAIVEIPEEIADKIDNITKEYE